MTVEKFEPGSSATYFTARHGDSALSPGFDDAYRLRLFAERMRETEGRGAASSRETPLVQFARSP